MCLNPYLHLTLATIQRDSRQPLPLLFSVAPTGTFLSKDLEYVSKGTNQMATIQRSSFFRALTMCQIITGGIAFPI